MAPSSVSKSLKVSVANPARAKKHVTKLLIFQFWFGDERGWQYSSPD